MNEQFTIVNSRLLSKEDRLAALELKNCVEETKSQEEKTSAQSQDCGKNMFSDC